MVSDEEEDVLMDNSPLYEHLRNVGFDDVGAVKYTRHAPTFEQKMQPTESIDGDTMEQILILRSTNLLFEDDLDHIESITSKFDVKKVDTLKYIFRGKSCAFAVLLAMCFYVFFGSISYVLISIFYTYRASDYLWRKHTRLKYLKKLASVLQSNSSLLTRIMKFLYENEQMLKLRFKPGSCSDMSHVVSSLKSDFKEMLSEINEIFANGTKNLLNTIPLCDYLETPENFTCLRMDSFEFDGSISQLHNLYLLLQSQFVTRLIFSIIPKLHVKNEDYYESVMKNIISVIFKLEMVEASLNKKFQIVLLTGIQIKPSVGKPLPQKSRSKSSMTMFCDDIHDLSNSLQYSLLKSRELEDNLEKYDLQEELEKINKELSSCQSLINNMIIVQNKRTQEKSVKEGLPNFGGENLIRENEPAIELGFSDLDPVVQDDIFEITSDETIESVPNFTYDPEENIDPFFKRRQKQLLHELKGKLKHQAEDWARREALVLAKKGLPPPENICLGLEGSSNESDSEDSVEELCGLRKRKSNKYGCQFYSNMEGDPQSYVMNDASSSLAETLLNARDKINFGEECTFGDLSDSSQGD